MEYSLPQLAVDTFFKSQWKAETINADSTSDTTQLYYEFTLESTNSHILNSVRYEGIKNQDFFYFDRGTLVLSTPHPHTYCLTSHTLHSLTSHPHTLTSHTLHNFTSHTLYTLTSHTHTHTPQPHITSQTTPSHHTLYALTSYTHYTASHHTHTHTHYTLTSHTHSTVSHHTLYTLTSHTHNPQSHNTHTTRASHHTLTLHSLTSKHYTPSHHTHTLFAPLHYPLDFRSNIVIYTITITPSHITHTTLAHTHGHTPHHHTSPTPPTQSSTSLSPVLTMPMAVQTLISNFESIVKVSKARSSL